MKILNRLILKIIEKNLSVRKLNLILYRKLNRNNKFIFNNIYLTYLNHSYNNNRLTERSIEIPIIINYLINSKTERVLEIGNVSNYYYTSFKEVMKERIVIDKSENFNNVILKDIYDYTTINKFLFIYSISTFEHMDKPLRNITYVIKELLSIEGIFIFTFLKNYSSNLKVKDILSILKFYKELLIIKSYMIYYFENVNEIYWIQKKTLNENKNLIIVEIRK